MHVVGRGVDGVEQPAEYPGDDSDNASNGSHPLIMAAIASIGTGQEVPIENGTGAPRPRDGSGDTVVS